MQRAGQSYSSGEWLVRAGSEEEFVDRWNAFIEWTADNAAGAESFVLVRSTEEPRRFLSLGAWESQEAQDAWREMPRMQELLGRCRQLCEEFGSHSYALAARACYELGQKPHRNADSTFDLVPSRSPFSAYLSCLLSSS